MKNKLKKLSILGLAGLMMYTSNLSYVSAISPNINSSEVQLITDEKEILETYAPFDELFVEEMAQLEKLGQSRVNQGKTTDQLLAETQDMTPIIDVEKNVGDDYYRVVGYRNGIYYQTGVRDGSSSTGSGYVNYKNRIAYGRAQHSSVNWISGHSFSIKLDYTIVNNGYDYIETNSDWIGPEQLAISQFYRHSASYRETSSKKAFTKWQYIGRNDLNGATGTYTMTVSVGGNGISVTGAWIA